MGLGTIETDSVIRCRDGESEWAWGSVELPGQPAARGCRSAASPSVEWRGALSCAIAITSEWAEGASECPVRARSASWHPLPCGGGYKRWWGVVQEQQLVQCER